MNERRDGQGPVVIDGVSIYEGGRVTSIFNIPSDAPDDTGMMDLEWAVNSDAHARLTDSNPDKIQPNPTMRFRDYFGGPRLPMISALLSTLPKSFLVNQGRHIVEDPVLSSEGVAYGDPVKVELGTEEDDFELRVTDITEDEEYPGKFSKFMDITVSKNGNVTVTMRAVRRVQPTVKSILFKSGENGGRFPVMAEVFTRIAREIKEEFEFGDDLGAEEVDDDDYHADPDPDRCEKRFV